MVATAQNLHNTVIHPVLNRQIVRQLMSFPIKTIFNPDLASFGLTNTLAKGIQNCTLIKKQN